MSTKKRAGKRRGEAGPRRSFGNRRLENDRSNAHFNDARGNRAPFENVGSGGLRRGDGPARDAARLRNDDGLRRAALSDPTSGDALRPVATGRLSDGRFGRLLFFAGRGRFLRRRFARLRGVFGRIGGRSGGRGRRNVGGRALDGLRGVRLVRRRILDGDGRPVRRKARRREESVVDARIRRRFGRGNRRVSQRFGGDGARRRGFEHLLLWRRRRRRVVGERLLGCVFHRVRERRRVAGTVRRPNACGASFRRVVFILRIRRFFGFFVGVLSAFQRLDFAFILGISAKRIGTAGATDGADERRAKKRRQRDASPGRGTKMETRIFRHRGSKRPRREKRPKRRALRVRNDGKTSLGAVFSGKRPSSIIMERRGFFARFSWPFLFFFLSFRENAVGWNGWVKPVDWEE